MINLFYNVFILKSMAASILLSGIVTFATEFYCFALHLFRFGIRFYLNLLFTLPIKSKNWRSKSIQKLNFVNKQFETVDLAYNKDPYFSLNCLFVNKGLFDRLGPGRPVGSGKQTSLTSWPAPSHMTINQRVVNVVVKWHQDFPLCNGSMVCWILVDRMYIFSID